MRASKIDAYRELAEQVYGMRVSGRAELQDQRLGTELTSGAVDGVIRGAKWYAATKSATAMSLNCDLISARWTVCVTTVKCSRYRKNVSKLYSEISPLQIAKKRQCLPLFIFVICSGFDVGPQRRHRMCLASGVVGHPDFAMALLHQVIQLVETQLRSGKRFTVHGIGLLAVEHDRANLFHQVVQIFILCQARYMRMVGDALIGLL